MGAGVQLKLARFRERERDAWLTSALAILNPAERERVATMPDNDSRTQHAVGRALIRLMAAQASSGDPRLVDITLSASGKPLLRDLHVSVAHTLGLVVAGASPSTAIGVDVEPALSAVDRQRRLAERLFDVSEVAALRDMPDARLPDWFSSVWTIKEAVGKALGDGIVPALSGAVVAQDAGGFRLTSVWSGPAADSWTLHQLIAPGGAEKIAVVLPAPNVPLESASLMSLEEFAYACSEPYARDT